MGCACCKQKKSAKAAVATSAAVDITDLSPSNPDGGLSAALTQGRYCPDPTQTIPDFNKGFSSSVIFPSINTHQRPGCLTSTTMCVCVCVSVCLSVWYSSQCFWCCFTVMQFRIAILIVPHSKLVTVNAFLRALTLLVDVCLNDPSDIEWLDTYTSCVWVYVCVFNLLANKEIRIFLPVLTTCMACLYGLIDVLEVLTAIVVQWRVCVYVRMQVVEWPSSLLCTTTMLALKMTFLSRKERNFTSSTTRKRAGDKIQTLKNVEKLWIEAIFKSETCV